MKWGALLAAAAIAATAQPNDEVRVSGRPYTPPQLHLSAQTTLVELEVVVRDSRGQSMGGLKQDDFEILDEGKPRGVSWMLIGAVVAATIYRALSNQSVGTAEIKLAGS